MWEYGWDMFIFTKLYGFSDVLPELKTATLEWICQPDGLLVGLGEVGPQVGGLNTEYQNKWWEAREVPHKVTKDDTEKKRDDLPISQFWQTTWEYYYYQDLIKH